MDDDDTYLEDCCWNDIRDHCQGAGCACCCHTPRLVEYTRAQKAEAFAAADRYFERMAKEALVPESVRAVGRRPNPLLGIFYADGYLEGKLRADEHGSALRVAARMILKGYETLKNDPNATVALLPGIAALRAALQTKD